MPLEEHINNVAQRVRDLAIELESELSGRSEFVFEVGSGHGHWLVDFGATVPDRLCIGIDIVNDRIGRSRRKADRARLPNVRFVRALAAEFLDALPEAVRLSDVFILFPDPWPKKRHWKNRVFQAPFLDRLAERALPGARVHFRTDSEAYFDWAKGIAAAHRSWEIDEETPWPFERETVFQARAPAYQSLILRKR